MPILELYHGADARRMLYNIEHRGLTTDNTGKLYFAQNQWASCLVHGADLATGESYVARVRVNIPSDAQIERTPRAGNPDALIVTTVPSRLLSSEFLELIVRRGTRDEGFEVARIPGPTIETYLRNLIG